MSARTNNLYRWLQQAVVRLVLYLGLYERVPDVEYQAMSARPRLGASRGRPVLPPRRPHRAGRRSAPRTGDHGHTRTDHASCRGRRPAPRPSDHSCQA